MSVVDPVKFMLSLIIIGGLLQFVGIMEGPCNYGPW
jgi:hypothetical protein